MSKTIAKKILSNLSDLRSYYSLLHKFKLYGDYKGIYKWENYHYVDKHKKIFKPLKKHINLKWFEYFTLIRQEEDPYYVPEDIWHINIEPVLNNRSYAKAFDDKNLYDLTPYQHLFPKTYLHVIQGAYYDENYNPINVKDADNLIPKKKNFLVKKTIDTGGGREVGFYNPLKENITLKMIIQKFGEDIIIQEVANQNKWFAKFNPSSVNTIRVMTYRSVVDEKIHVLQLLFRIGKMGSKVDNQTSGGIAVGIKSDGSLNDWGCDKLSHKYYKINGTSLSQSSKIPNYKKLKQTCKDIAKSRFYERILVFDTWQDFNGNVRLVEINNKNIGIEDLQKNNGALFGKYTEEIVNWCSKHKRSYCYDFEI